MSVAVDRVVLHRLRVPLLRPFRISVGEVAEKEFMLVEAHAGGHVGWGEAAVDGVPFYTWETADTAMALGKRIFAPLLKSRAWAEPAEFVDAMDLYRGHNFTKAAFEAALWDLAGQACNTPVARLLGGTRRWVTAGPSIGIKNNPGELVREVGVHLDEAPTCRIKIKVAPGFDTEFIAAVREAYPDCTLMVDANSAYGPDDLERIGAWDRFNLLMIEQPFDLHDLHFHSLLCRAIGTPVCLDESIETEPIAVEALAVKAADIVNIKVGRVGGLVHTRRIHDLCQAAGVPNWIGSRLGTGVALAMRLAAASLPGASLPSDVGFGLRHMADDVVSGPPEIRNGCEYRVPDAPGMGIEVDVDKVEHYAVERVAF